MYAIKRSEPIVFSYKYLFNDGQSKYFIIKLDPVTLDYLPEKVPEQLPDWTLLRYNQCENCPYKMHGPHHCPIAVNIVELFDCFNSIDSFDRTRVYIRANDRGYYRESSVQRSLSSMLGIYMATSGCPLMNRLKPMVRFHLPLASIEETVYRSVCTYLMAQYFNRKRGFKADLDLKNLKAFYIDIQKVNLGIVRRLRSVTEKDAFANAIVKLDAYARELPRLIEERLENFEYLFAAYYNQQLV